MKISDYMPKLYKNNIEMLSIIHSEEKELENNLKQNIDNRFKDNFVNTATERGISKYEKIYGINASNSKKLYERKFDLRLKQTNKTPFNIDWLINKLEILVGKDNYRIYIDYENYKVEISIASLFTGIAVTLSKSLREQIPANMIVEVNLFQTEMANMYVGGIMREGKYIKIGSEEVG